MRNLFEIGLNDGGFFVFPFNSPPKYQATGDEVGLQQSCNLRDSLNRSVQAYIEQSCEDEPASLIQVIMQRQSDRDILKFIEDFLWLKYLRLPGATPQGTLYQNWLALTRLIAGWQ